MIIPENSIVTLVGSREAPAFALELASKIGKYLAERGCVRRSGDAIGMDQAWLKFGPYDKDEVFRPSNDGRGINVQDYLLDEYEEIARSLVPHYDNEKTSRIAQLMHSRNVCQVLGLYLDKPSDYLLFWAPETARGQVSGGTRTAVRLARRHNIPCFNLDNWDVMKWWINHLNIPMPAMRAQASLSFLEK